MNSFYNYQNVDSYWYNQIPSSWNKTKNKFVFTQNKVVVGEEWKNFTLLTMGKSGVKPRDMDAGGKFPESFENYQTVNPNQIIFCLFDLDETPRTVGLSKDHGMITSAYDVFSTNEEHDPQFWTYFYQMIDDHKGLRPYYTGLRKVVRYDTFMGIEVFAPPLNEQNLIARYLDKKTDQIDRLVEKIQKKIELLKEQRTSLINHYVTKGLDPNVDMKDSGIEWIGEIPKHWNLGKIKYLSNLITKGTTPSNIGEDFDDYGSVRFIKGEDLLDGYIKPTGSSYISEDVDKKLKRSQLEVGDLLVVIAGTLGKCAVVTEEVIPANTNQAISLIRMKDWVNSNYVRFWFETSSCKNQVNEFAVVAAQPNLSMEDLGNIVIPVVSEEEQNQIEEFLRKKNQLFAERLEKETKKQQLLLEYRQSLISSAVTGKIRITEEMI